MKSRTESFLPGPRIALSLKKRITLVLLAALLFTCLGLPACSSSAETRIDESPSSTPLPSEMPDAEPSPIVLWTFADPAEELTQIRAAMVDESLTLFLPSSMSLEAVPLFFQDESVVELTGANGVRLSLASGASADLSVFPGDGRTEARCTLNFGARSEELTVLRSESIDAMFLVSSDPAEHGRDWVESSKDHTNKTTGSMALIDPSGNAVYCGALSQIRGRGNSTWGKPKRPYQIKLDQKTDLLNTGNDANVSKTWLLLANYMDASLIRNDLILTLARSLGLEDTPEYTHTDLWYDGEYRGSYLLTEKVEVGSGRVEIRNLEKALEEANPDYDFDAPTLKQDTTPWGTRMQYVEGLSEPEDFTGGYLLEMENETRIEDETSWFQTRNGDYLLVNSPEAVSRDELLYIAGIYQAFEDAVLNGGVNPETGMHYTEYADFDSLVSCYLVMEASGNSESYINSTYFYKNAGEDKLHCGPIWDYDLSLSVLSTELRAGKTRLGSALLALPDFSARVEELYRETLYPWLGEIISQDGWIEDLRAQLSASARMNYMLWPYCSFLGEAQAGDGFDENVDYVAGYLSQRRDFLLTAFEEHLKNPQAETAPLDTPAPTEAVP